MGVTSSSPNIHLTSSRSSIVVVRVYYLSVLEIMVERLSRVRLF